MSVPLWTVFLEVVSLGTSLRLGFMEEAMWRRAFVAAVATASLVVLTKPSLAAETGSAAEAKALLEKAVAAVKADKMDAIAKFNKADAGFRDRDLYVFCAAPDGKLEANANKALIGTDLRTTKDKAGKMFGKEMFDTAQEGKFTEVTYMWPKPGTTEPVQKVSYVTRIGDEICGVGYYK
jgi:signal transduction histidine kinase